MWPLAIAGLAAAGLVVFALRRRPGESNVWGRAAAQLGTLSIRFDDRLQTLGGVLEGIPVSVRVGGFGGAQMTRIVAAVDAPEGFGFRPRDSVMNGRGATEVTGDEAFDAAVLLEGPRVAGTAMLDAALRTAIVSAAAHGACLEKGEVVIRRAGIVTSGEQLAELVRLVAGLSRRITDAHRADRVSRLADVATGDPLPGVRRRALRVLIDHHKEDPAARSALDRALVDADVEVRMMGASGLGPSGFEAMRSIANDAMLPSPVRAAALDKLLALFPRSQSVPALMKALDDRSSAARKIAITALGKMRHAAAVPSLLGLARRPLDLEERAVLAQALGRIGDPAAEPALLALLDTDDADVRIAVANALAKVGSAASVEPLTPLARASLLQNDLGRAASFAIERIQSRLAKAGGSQGQLAITDPDSDEGRVSLPVQDGALDLDDEGDVGIVPRRKQPAST